MFQLPEIPANHFYFIFCCQNLESATGMQTFLHISMEVKMKVCQWEMESHILLPQKMETLEVPF